MITTTLTTLDNNECSRNSEKRYESNIIIFGSTGLTGSLIFDYLLDPGYYIDHSTSLRRIMMEAVNERKESITYKMTFYCFNRKMGESVSKCLKVPGPAKFKPFSFAGSEYHYSKGTCIPLELEQENELYNDSVFDGFLYYKQKTKNIGGINISGEYFSREYMYFIEFITVDGKSLKFNFIFNHVQLIVKNSFLWPKLLPVIFSKEIEAVAFKDKTPMKRYFPQLDTVNLMLSTLGTTTARNKANNTKYDDIDYQLNFDLAKAFTCSVEKRIIVVTAFNNNVISGFSSYFKAKQKLEYSLKEELTPPLQKLTILRPGPLVGRHSEIFPNNGLISTSLGLLDRLLLHKKTVLQNLECLVDDLRTGGITVKASDLVARLFYRVPGSSLLGYCIPANKVAHALAFFALSHEGAEPNEMGNRVSIISSQEMDYMC
ncbi:Protein HIM1 [Nakaseomyces bracarensis]|uniref:Protein HIM1 n=1 Tax=Nakaseomyces bracarensis TaxID=273131 RepID=A0ABR4NYE6_9SACH